MTGKVFIDDKRGWVSTRLLQNPTSSDLLLLAHGAGAGMEHPFMEGLAQALLDEKIASLRFNFPYMEKGKKRPDHKSVAISTIRAVYQFAMKESSLPISLGGKSFGGRMASHLLADDAEILVQSIVFYGFPLHAPGRQGSERAMHLSNLTVPMLFLQGTRDSLAEIGLMKELAKSLPQAQLDILEGADHGFRFLKKFAIDSASMYKMLAAKTRSFLTGIK